MKVVVTSTGPELNSQIDPRVGRCTYFIFVDPETLEFEAVQNPNVQAMGGAGIQSAQLIANKGAEVVLTGSCGPNAFQTLQAAGIKVIVGVTGLVKDAVQRYKTGQLQPTIQPNAPSHFGMGYGRGMGMGMGRGRGMGMGYGYMPYGPQMSPPGSQPPPSSAPQMNPDQEIQMLKQQAEYLSQQLEAITKRIKELGEKGKQG